MTMSDRFIPNRWANPQAQYDFFVREERSCSPTREAYGKELAKTLGLNHTRLLYFGNKPKPDVKPRRTSPPTATTTRCIPWCPERTLDLPDIVDDFNLNVLDWGSANLLAIGLGHTVYIINACDGSAWELFTTDEDQGPVTSISWAPDGHHLAVGLSNSQVQVWDSSHSGHRLITTLNDACHDQSRRVASIAWNGNWLLTTGGKDGKISNNDVRISSLVQTYYKGGHSKEVCGLKWSEGGTHLASGGADNLVHIWDIASSSSSSDHRPLHRFNEHTSTVKALAWCPFQYNLLATGGGEGDGRVKFWNTNTGACLNSIYTTTASEGVSSLLWSKKEKELLISHGLTLTLRKYPSLVKMAHITGHRSTILYMVPSPNGCTVASASAGILNLWNIFGDPHAKRPSNPNALSLPFSSHGLIR